MKHYHKYWRIAKKLKQNQLQKFSASDAHFSENDLFTLNIGKRGYSLFLGFYSEAGIKLALDKYGIYGMLQNNGFDRVITHVDTTDTFKHRLCLYDGVKNNDKLIAEIELKRDFITINPPFEIRQPLQTIPGLVINWLRLQNYKALFTENRPRLPGQRFPGLGLAKHVIELLSIICWRLKIGCITINPEHYHNAVMYSKIFRFVNPETQSKFETLKTYLDQYPLYKASWGVALGCVHDCFRDETFTWFSEKQIVAFDKRLLELFQGKEYKSFIKENKKKYSFIFNEEMFCKRYNQLTKNDMEKYI